MTRTERSSLFPTESSASMPPPAVINVPAPRNSMTPEPIARGSLRIEAGWEELGTGAIPSMIPKAPPPPRFAAGPNSIPPGSSMIPKAPPPPRFPAGPNSMSPGSSLRPAPGELRAPEPRQQAQRASWRPPADNANGVRDSWRPPSEAPPPRLPSWPPAEGLDADRVFRTALLYREQGNATETMKKLGELMRLNPEHADGRILLHKLALELTREDLAAQHSEWVIAHYAKKQAHGDVCAAYRRTRMAFAELSWSDRTLQAVVLAAERVGEPRVVLDATKLLLTFHPQSGALAQALYTSARVQHNEGRPDLARTTLQNLIARFPKDPLAVEARRRLVELGP